MFAVKLAHDVAEITGAELKVSFLDDVSQEATLALNGAKLSLTQYRGGDTEGTISVVLSDGTTKMIATRRFEEDEADALVELLVEAAKYGAHSSASIADQIRIAAPEMVECVWADGSQLTTLLLVSGEKLTLCAAYDMGVYEVFNDRFRTIVRATDGDVVATLVAGIASYMEKRAARA